MIAIGFHSNMHKITLPLIWMHDAERDWRTILEKYKSFHQWLQSNYSTCYSTRMFETIEELHVYKWTPRMFSNAVRLYFGTCTCTVVYTINWMKTIRYIFSRVQITCISFVNSDSNKPAMAFSKSVFIMKPFILYNCFVLLHVRLVWTCTLVVS